MRERVCVGVVEGTAIRQCLKEKGDFGTFIMVNLRGRHLWSRGAHQH